jgi:hypothetical protein
MWTQKLVDLIRLSKFRVKNGILTSEYYQNKFFWYMSKDPFGKGTEVRTLKFNKKDVMDKNWTKGGDFSFQSC